MPRDIEQAAAIALWIAGLAALILKPGVPPSGIFELARDLYVCLAVAILSVAARQKYSSRM